MERGRGDRSGFFGAGDPSGSFLGFGMMPSLFGGRDPFDDPFFSRPLVTSLEWSNTHGSRGGDRGVVIEELEPDDEADRPENDERSDRGTGSGSNQEPSVQHPDDDEDDADGAAGEGEGAGANDKRDACVESEGSKPRAGKFSFSISKVTYGGVDGAYYTSSRTRRTGDDGTLVEEKREADKVTGRASHRISRGIHDKGHSVTRKLNTDGKVDTLQTLHNLHEDELARFEEAWKGNFKAPSFGSSNQSGFRDAAYDDRTANEGWARPSVEQAQRVMDKRSEVVARSNQSAARPKKVVRINIE